MLNRSQKEKIMTMRIYEYSHLEKEGVPIIYGNKPFYIPTFYEIKEMIFNQIFNLGYSKIERVAQSEANCIIRLFKKQHHPYNNIFIYSIYGANCYVRIFGDWVTKCNDKPIPIDHSECIVRHWIYNEECVDINCEFFDITVKIS